MNVTELATGKVGGADTLTIELAEPPDMPASILIRWPQQPSIATPATFDKVASDVMRLLANAVIRLAQIRGEHRL